ncbi:26S proteasome non-ATPase regulatory subunit 9 [Plodia interpunctella]|uniref:26S proteasome non-ATPase regulatory subunit 9 n=1 Tax=Plodia interpunctella TaxID=58824 RepID=UPI002368385B|nr:26S proteasome non-ATPase regulatory subunit 9 [Plodia interpunctella]
MVGYNMDGPARDRVMRLMEDKDRIEREIAECNAVLETNNVGMSDPLVDAEGFPRGDIDVYRVRHARHRIICLQNDHKEIMKRIERGLAEVHSNLIGANGEGPSVPQPMVNGNGHVTHIPVNISHLSIGHQNGDSNDRPFATVGPVHDGSPADVAGLTTDDEILQFGSINHTNFSDMTQINDLVSHSVGQRIHVKVRRQEHVLTLTVVPRPWQQPGLLGCQIRRIML